MSDFNKKFHYVAGSSVLPPAAEQDIALLRRAMISLFPDNLDNAILIKNIKRVCSPLEFENIQVQIKKTANENQAPQFNYGAILQQEWRKKADEMRLDIETAAPQEILIRAGHIFRPKFQRFVKKMANRFNCNNKQKSPNKLDGFKIRRNDKDTFRMRQKERDRTESCYKKPEKHTDILAGMIFPETNDMMEAATTYFTPFNNSDTIKFKPKYKRPDDTGFGGIHLTTMIHADIGKFKNVPFIVELQAHKKDTYKAYEETHERMERVRAFDSWTQNQNQNPFTVSRPQIISSLGKRLIGHESERLKINQRANASLSKFQQTHEYHIVDGTPVISVTSAQGPAYDHFLVPTYKKDRNNTFLTMNNAYGEKISSNTKVSREQCITRLHAIAHENSSSTRLQYIPRQEPMNHHLKPKLIYSQ